MTQANATIRERIQAQGFCGYDDETYAKINYPLRLAPSICIVWAGIGTTLASSTAMWILALFAAMGVVLPSHPFDAIYNYGLRHLTGTAPIPRYPLRRRFACFMATLMLVAAAWAFQAGMTMVGYVVGWSFVLLAFGYVSTGFCVPSFLYRLAFGKVACN